MEDLTDTIHEILDGELDKEEINQASRRVLLELLLVCDNNGLSMQGLIEEFQAGIRQDYINTVGLGNAEVKDLDIERMARIGEKRRKLSQETNTEDKETKDWPNKIVKAELEV